MPTSNLQLTADSSQIRSAKNDLDALTASSRGAEVSTKAVEQVFIGVNRQAKSAAQSASVFSEAMSSVDDDVRSAARSLEQFVSDQVKAGRTITSTGQIVDSTGRSFNELESDLSRLTTQFNNASSNADRFDQSMDSIRSSAGRSTAASVNNLSKATGNFSRQAGQAGIQIEQLISGIAAGQKPTQALAFQAADLGIVLGFPLVGAIAGVTAALAGPFISSLINSSSEISELVGGIRDLEGGAKRTANENLLLAASNEKEVESLSKRNEEIAKQIVRLQEVIDLQSSAGTGTDTGDFAVPRTAEQNQRRFADSIRESSLELNSLRAELDGNNRSIIELDNETANLTRQIDDSVLSLQVQIKSLQEGERAAAIFALEQNAVTAAQKEQLPTLIALTNQRFDLVESTKRQTQSQTELDRTLTQIFANGEKLEQQRQRELERQSASFESLRQRLVLEQTSLTLGNERLELERNLLALGKSDGSQDFQDRVTAITDLTLQLQALRNEAELIGPALDQSLRQIGLSAIDEMSSGLAGVISQGDSLRDTIGSIANTILNDLLTAAIRYFVGSAAQALVTTGATTAASVSSLSAIGAAATPAAIAVNIATLGAAATAATATAAASIPVQAGLIANSGLAGFELGGFTGTGGRQDIAGFVHGQEFVVNARNTARNRSTLEAMNRGEDISGSNVIVNVTNNSSNSDIQTTESTGPNDERVIDIVVANIDQRGRIQRSITRNTTAANRI